MDFSQSVVESDVACDLGPLRCFKTLIRILGSHKTLLYPSLPGNLGRNQVNDHPL